MWTGRKVTCRDIFPLTVRELTFCYCPIMSGLRVHSSRSNSRVANSIKPIHCKFVVRLLRPPEADSHDIQKGTGHCAPTRRDPPKAGTTLHKRARQPRPYVLYRLGSLFYHRRIQGERVIPLTLISPSRGERIWRLIPLYPPLQKGDRHITTYG